jgi:hypothetical protein
MFGAAANTIYYMPPRPSSFVPSEFHDDNTWDVSRHDKLHQTFLNAIRCDDDFVSDANCWSQVRSEGSLSTDFTEHGKRNKQ